MWNRQKRLEMERVRREEGSPRHTQPLLTPHHTQLLSLPRHTQPLSSPRHTPHVTTFLTSPQSSHHTLLTLPHFSHRHTPHVSTLGLVTTLSLSLHLSTLNIATLVLSPHVATLGLATLTSPHNSIWLFSCRSIALSLDLYHLTAPSFLNKDLIMLSVESRSKFLSFHLNQSFRWDFTKKISKMLFFRKSLV